MAVQFISVKCPECGATLSVENDRKFAFCSYCGTKVIISNENEHIYRTIDEAGIKQAETDRIVKLRQLDMEEKAFFFKKNLGNYLDCFFSKSYYCWYYRCCIKKRKFTNDRCNWSCICRDVWGDKTL